MKRKLKWLALVLAVLLLGYGTALLLWPRDRITVESWQKIRIGMTEEEVAEILGEPGMSRAEDLAEYNRLLEELGRVPFEYEGPTLEEPDLWPGFLVPSRHRIWNGRRGSIVIQFDEDNHVWWKRFHGMRWINGGILDRLRDWLGW
jgi:hypothetical protein